MSLRRFLLLAFSVGIILVVAQAAGTQFFTQQLHRTSDQLVTSVKARSALRGFYDAAGSLDQELSRFLEGSDLAEIKEVVAVHADELRTRQKELTQGLRQVRVGNDMANRQQTGFRDLNQALKAFSRAGQTADAEDPAFTAIEAIMALNEIQPELNQAMDDAQTAAIERQKQRRHWPAYAAAGFTFTAVALFTALGWSIASYLNRSVTQVVQGMNRMAEGDLSSRSLPQTRINEIHNLHNSLERMRSDFARTVGVLQESTQALKDAHTSLETNASEAARNADAQKSATGEATAASRALSDSASSLLDRPEETVTAMQQLDTDATGVRDQVARNHSIIGELSDQVQEAATSTSSVREESTKVDSVVCLIKEVADQTNLLALNAAIEAARAGEHGRGFAVVADEVRNLARKTQSSTEEIDNMLSELRRQIDSLEAIMQQGYDKSQAAVDAASDAENGLNQISTEINRLVSHNSEMAHALTEQHNATDNIRGQLEQIDQVTERQVEGANNVHGASESLGQVADRIESIINHFKTDR